MSGHNMFTGRGKDPVPVMLEGEELEQALEAGDVFQDEEHGLDRIYILRKMGYGQKQKIMGFASKMSLDKKALAAAQARAGGRNGQAGQVPGMPPPANVATLEPERAQEGSEEELALEATGGMDMSYDVAAYNIELLVLNIVSWQGPSFAGVAVTRENILDLDPDNPLVVKTVQEIARRNMRRKGQPGPKH